MQVQDTKTEQPAERTQLSAEEAQIYAERRPNGEAVAALMSAGIGVFALGFFTTLVEASPDIKSWLTFNNGVGPLSGKTILAVAVWLISWIALTVVWKNKSVNFAATMAVTVALIALGVLGTFPLFFQLFG